MAHYHAGQLQQWPRAARQHDQRPATRRLPQEISLALIGLNMPGMEKGFRMTDLAREQPSLPVVVVSALTSPHVVRRTLAPRTSLRSSRRRHCASRAVCGSWRAGKNLKWATACWSAKTNCYDFNSCPRMYLLG